MRHCWISHLNGNNRKAKANLIPSKPNNNFMSAALRRIKGHSPARIGKHQQHRAIVLPDIQLIFIHGLSAHNKGSGFSRLHVDPLFSLQSERKRDGKAKPNQQIDKMGQQWQILRGHSQIQNITLLGVDIYKKGHSAGDKLEKAKETNEKPFWASLLL